MTFTFRSDKDLAVDISHTANLWDGKLERKRNEDDWSSRSKEEIISYKQW